MDALELPSNHRLRAATLTISLPPGLPSFSRRAAATCPSLVGVTHFCRKDTTIGRPPVPVAG